MVKWLTVSRLQTKHMKALFCFMTFPDFPKEQVLGFQGSLGCFLFRVALEMKVNMEYWWDDTDR
jgi:hypothetical protein